MITNNFNSLQTKQFVASLLPLPPPHPSLRTSTMLKRARAMCFFFFFCIIILEIFIISIQIYISTFFFSVMPITQCHIPKYLQCTYILKAIRKCAQTNRIWQSRVIKCNFIARSIPVRHMFRTYVRRTPIAKMHGVKRNTTRKMSIHFARSNQMVVCLALAFWNSLTHALTIHLHHWH